MGPQKSNKGPARGPAKGGALGPGPEALKRIVTRLGGPLQGGPRVRSEPDGGPLWAPRPVSGKPEPLRGAPGDLRDPPGGAPPRGAPGPEMNLAGGHFGPRVQCWEAGAP